MQRIFFLFIACLIGLASAQAQDYNQVYIIGGATPYQWDNSKALPMEKVEGTEATFTWTGTLYASDFKFISYLNTFHPSFNATTENEVVELGKVHSLVYATGEDYKFVLEKRGKYTVTVDLKALTMTIVDAGPEDEIAVWIMGDGIDEAKSKLFVDRSGKENKLRYTGPLGKGSVKFRTTETINENTLYYVPVEEYIDIQDASDYQITADANAPGWNVMVADPYYKIKMDVFTNTITTERMRPRYGLYIIGGCTTAGWNAANAIPFESSEDNPYIFVYEGELRIHKEFEESNLFKILGQLDWGPYSLHPYTAQEPIIGSKYVLENEGDDKWSIDENRQGNYRITVDLINETIDAQFLDEAGGTTSLKTDGKPTISAKGGSIHVRTSHLMSCVQLTDVSGRIIATQANCSNATLGNKLPKGIYMVSIWSNSRRTVKKVHVK